MNYERFLQSLGTLRACEPAYRDLGKVVPLPDLSHSVTPSSYPYPSYRRSYAS